MGTKSDADLVDAQCDVAVGDAANAGQVFPSMTTDEEV